MIRKISAVLAALAFAFTKLAPAAADARDRRGHGYERHYYRDYDHRRHRRDNGDAIAAGAVGLILGLAIGSMASQPRERDYCRDDYRRCAPPPPPRDCRNPCRYDDSYYREDPRYYEDRGGSAYEDEYGYEGRYDPELDDRAGSTYRDSTGRCVRQERVWDSRQGRYVYDEVPC